MHDLYTFSAFVKDVKNGSFGYPEFACGLFETDLKSVPFSTQFLHVSDNHMMSFLSIILFFVCKCGSCWDRTCDHLIMSEARCLLG